MRVECTNRGSEHAKSMRSRGWDICHAINCGMMGYNWYHVHLHLKRPQKWLTDELFELNQIYMLFGYLLANRKWKTLSQPLDSGRFPNVCKQTQNMGSPEYRVPLDPLVNYHFAYEYCNSGVSYHMFRHTHLFYLLSSGYLS